MFTYRKHLKPWEPCRFWILSHLQHCCLAWLTRLLNNTCIVLENTKRASAKPSPTCFYKMPSFLQNRAKSPKTIQQWHFINTLVESLAITSLSNAFCCKNIGIISVNFRQRRFIKTFRKRGRSPWATKFRHPMEYHIGTHNEGGLHRKGSRKGGKQREMRKVIICWASGCNVVNTCCKDIDMNVKI